MILLIAIVVGLAAGVSKAKLIGVTYQPVELRQMWLLLLAALPQFLAFSLPVTRERIPETLIPIILIGTQLLLFIFVWMNRTTPFVWLLGLGLFLNFLVIFLNGGWMPISPETLESQGVPDNHWQVGSRLGHSKDIVLLKDESKLWILSDILTLPSWIPYRVAFSIGDVLIAFGVISMLLQNRQSKTFEIDQQENKKI
jgi:hypothetical protein